MIFIIILIAAICFCGGIIIGYKINQFNAIPIIEINKETTAHNEELREKEQELTLLIKAQNDSLLAGTKELNELDSKITALKLEEVTQKQNIQESMNREAERLSKWIAEQRNSYEQEYLRIMEACALEFNKNIKAKEEQITELNSLLLEAEQRQAVLVAENIKNYHDIEQINLYTLHIPKESIKDIKKLREVAELISDSSILNKLIWKQYYEKAFTDLIGRTIGTNSEICGIYKITNLNNGKIYIGQSVNVKERFRTHMKRGVGAEPVTQNKLYPAMYEEGIENFSYELIEQCAREDLDKEEKYWIKFYKAQEFGYNETRGNG